MRSILLFVSFTLLNSGCFRHAPASEAHAPDHARSVTLARQFIIADGHIDLPMRLYAKGHEARDPAPDLATGNAGDFDIPRATAGGLNAPFMSIYVPAKHQKTPGQSKTHADTLIDMMEAVATQHSAHVALATSVDEIERLHAEGKIALPMGIENGAAIEDEIDNVDHFYRRGVRYITLTHSKDNQICDSSYDDTRTWGGLSPFGRQVVERMNQVGIMVDVSHVTDDTIRQVLELSKVPVIASHSSCRHFVPGFERNLSDALIRAIAEKDGVILVNFGSSFVKQASRAHFDARRKAIADFRAQHGEAPSDKLRAFEQAYDRDHPPVLATVEDVADHIDHIVKLVGIDHVGFGSDFDGVGPTLPRGLEDVSKYPNLIRVLLERGYSEDDVEKISSKNLFRVWRAVETYARAS